MAPRGLALDRRLVPGSAVSSRSHSEDAGGDKGNAESHRRGSSYLSAAWCPRVLCKLFFKTKTDQ